uniref:Alpha 1,4-glycosyltransferase domain-containing protein n=1 Tax=Chromera velia CCMP2878 TaxID=1169474 RepID=A0A0G4I5X9_9ALVE|eukprot:Cvel_11229.t1-p1 / transcript=Cvel_11229.t1 / gene=Cvel_11229 / organism=Chromera_velia_CCMP2878 / gene_product=Uncharacterized glycosyltransferase L373, putative / transcript_product=Uncharacterized glycosyltransferase L373, putative / location=Cvel_scaffold699:8827-15015(+) / protein_length=447 / sequence_SO=supercontig / SO=protein_coding / is_pseudo=false
MARQRQVPGDQSPAEAARDGERRNEQNEENVILEFFGYPSGSNRPPKDSRSTQQRKWKWNLWSPNDRQWGRKIVEHWRRHKEQEGQEMSHHSVIPKRLHQIWLGPKEIPSQCKEFMETWKRRHPEWEYKLWRHADVESLKLRNRSAYEEAENFAHKSDILRLELLSQFGGVYVDVDYECVGSLRELCESGCFGFFCGAANVGGVELNNGLMGASPGHPFVSVLMDRIAVSSSEHWGQWGGEEADTASRVFGILKALGNGLEGFGTGGVVGVGSREANGGEEHREKEERKEGGGPFTQGREERDGEEREAEEDYGSPIPSASSPFAFFLETTGPGLLTRAVCRLGGLGSGKGDGKRKKERGKLKEGGSSKACSVEREEEEGTGEEAEKTEDRSMSKNQKILVLPASVFCPIPNVLRREMRHEDGVRRLKEEFVKEDTLAIHHWMGTWQ